MKIAIVGAGAMGSLFARYLASHNEVALVEVSPLIVNTISSRGLRVDDKEGNAQTVNVPIMMNPAELGVVDLVIIFVKCYHTRAAASGILPLLGANTTVLTLQNGWGNSAVLQEIVGAERVLAGVTYNSATLVAPGHARHTASGRTIIGEFNGTRTARVEAIRLAFESGGMSIETTTQIVAEIWAKLAQTVCTLPTSALLNFQASELARHEGTLELMRALLRELVVVAHAQRIPIDFDERWQAITGAVGRAGTTKASMLQDIEAHRRTEIDVINGAVVAAGRQVNIPTPYNDTMVWMVKSLEETFDRRT